jgi:hypothetical protein
MRKIYLSFFALLFVGAMAAKAAPVNTTIKFTATAPVLDGVEEATWDAAPQIKIEKNFDSETPTVDPSYAKMLWNDTAIFWLMNVADDNWYPAELAPAGSADYMFDKCEIYMDVNDTILLGGGPATANSGTWQEAPAYLAADEGIMTYKLGWAEHSPNCYMSHAVTGGAAYVAEYCIPISGLYKKDSTFITLKNNLVIGLDFTVIDQDVDVTTTRERKVWQSDVNEAWNQMDACGTGTFSGKSAIHNQSIATVSAYPNPVVNTLTIDAVFTSAVVSNTLGQNVMIIDQVQGNTLDLATLPKGIYMVSIFNNGSSVGSVRVIK